MKKISKIIVSTALVASVAAVPALAFAAHGQQGGGFGGQQGEMPGQMQQGEMPSQADGMQGGMPGQRGGGMQGQMGGAQSASEPTVIQTSSKLSNSAESLGADTANAVTVVVSESNSDIKIKESGTYIITGSASNGNITVKKGTTGVVLVLKDLDLTSRTGATLSINKGSEVKIIAEGSVKLTDAESLADEDTDDFGGAAIKVKAGASVALTGSGTLIVNCSCKNGIKVSDLDDDDIADGYGEASLIIEGGLKLNVTAANDGINSGSDLYIKSGTVTVSAGDDGIKSDYILTIGMEGGSGPTVNIKNSEEGLEGATVNINSGSITVNATDDGINAGNSDLTGYTYSLNILGGTVDVSSGADGLDSNGNINLLGGLTTIVKAASNGGEGGIDYEGSFYAAEGTLVNPFGVTMDSGMGQRGQMGGMQNSGQPGQMNPDGQSGQQYGPQNGQRPEFRGWDSDDWDDLDEDDWDEFFVFDEDDLDDDDRDDDHRMFRPDMQDGAPQFGQPGQANQDAPDSQPELPELSGQQMEMNLFQTLMDALQKFFADFFKTNRAED